MSIAHKQLRFSNFHELQKTVEKKEVVPPSAKCNHYYSTATKLYEDALKAKLDGDLEKAFIYFVRFGKLALQLKRAPDFSKTSYPKLEKAADAISEAEMLQSELMKLYGVKPSKTSYPKLEKAADAISEAEMLQSELMKLYGVKPSKTSAASDCALDGVICQDPQDQQRRPTQVFELFDNQNCLVIDLRDQVEFEDSHIAYKYVFNLPGKFIEPGQTGGELEEATKNLQSHPMFLQRNAFEYIVILDYDTQNPFHAGVPDNHPIRLLYSILTDDYLKSQKLKNLPVILKGGYRLWLASYPQMTTNPHPRKLNESKPSCHYY